MGRNKTTLTVLGEVMKLIDEGILVRNTKDDADFKKFLEQGIRIVRVLKSAQEALEELNENMKGGNYEVRLD